MILSKKMKLCTTSSSTRTSSFDFRCLILILVLLTTWSNEAYGLTDSVVATDSHSNNATIQSQMGDDVCPDSKHDCDKSTTCHWSDRGRCVSSLPCVLESSEARCESNTIGCKWQGNQCERRVKNIQRGNDQCSQANTRSRCNDIKRCFWSTVRDRCMVRPTIILSLPDDLGWYDVGFHNPRSRTPTLDALRSSGIALERHYVNRFCAPTRAMLLTGRHAWKIGLQIDSNLNPVTSLRCASAPNVQLLPGILRKFGGYETHAFGKWHMGHYKTSLTPTGRGFDTFLGFYAGGIGDYVGGNNTGQFWNSKCACSGPSLRTIPQATCGIYAKGKKLCTKAVNIVSETATTLTFETSMYIDDNAADLLFARRASEIIFNTPLSTPLFFYMAWAATHNPIHSSQRHLDSILASKPKFGSDARLLNKCSQNLRLKQLGMVKALDESHRELLDALDATDRYDNTIFVFFSDNGGIYPHLKLDGGTCDNLGFNYPLRGSKYSWWDGGIRSVAFIASLNHIHPNRRGTSYHELISAIDWRKTLVKAAGIDEFQDADDDGINYWGKLSSSSQEANATLERLRTELPLQVWRETGRVVVLFYFQGDLWKIMKGYPAAASGNGYLYKTRSRYSLSEIEQPLELPRSEWTIGLQDGRGLRFECKPYCLSNLSKDPSELRDWRATSSRALQFGIKLVQKYEAQGPFFEQTGLCEPNFYSRPTKDVTDAWSIMQASNCGAFLPWLTEHSNSLKSACGK